MVIGPDHLGVGGRGFFQEDQYVIGGGDRAAMRAAGSGGEDALIVEGDTREIHRPPVQK